MTDALYDHETRSLHHFAEQAYLDYSMYVILDRALPHLSDGLKPVQRRIIYAMSELNLGPQAKPKKSARTIGNVLGQFHPHGDAACYEAMVMMAQDFSFRYPFIQGQGNWGSQDDPKSFAAMRYTEAKLSPYATALLTEIGQGTVTWQPNFDGSLQEPKMLPARLPNVILNGTSGIAVGMSTDIPPHNLKEVVAACVYLLDHPKASCAKLCQYIQGPDYPSGAEIISSPESLQQLYQTGQGSIRTRARYIVEEEDIVVVSLPYLVSGNKVLEQIAEQMQAKKLPWVTDLRDESDYENPTRLVICRKNKKIDVEQLMLHLFATTDLERSYRVNLNMVGLNGKPTTKNLPTILTEWLTYRQATVTRRLEHRLAKVESRLHILAGLLIAFTNIDEIIDMIRSSDTPKEDLQTRFQLSIEQATAILELRLKQLAKLEEQQLLREQKEFTQERDEIKKNLNSPEKLRNLVKKELLSDSDKYGDERRSPLVVRPEAAVVKDMVKATVEPVSIVLSAKGWIRAGKGHDLDPLKLSYRAGDSFKSLVYGKSDENVIAFGRTGQAYTMAVKDLPSTRGQGEPVTSKVKSKQGEVFQGLLAAHQQVILLSSDGYGLQTNFDAMMTRNKNGKAILTVPAQHNALFVPYHEETHVFLITELGHGLLISLTDLPHMTKGRGKKVIDIKKTERGIIQAIALTLQDSIILETEKKPLTLTPKQLDAFHGGLATRGKLLPKGARPVIGVQKKTKR